MLTREAFRAKFRHELSGMMLDAVMNGQGSIDKNASSIAYGLIGAFCSKITDKVDGMLNLMYDDLAAAMRKYEGNGTPIIPTPELLVPPPPPLRNGALATQPPHVRKDPIKVSAPIPLKPVPKGPS